MDRRTFVRSAATTAAAASLGCSDLFGVEDPLSGGTPSHLIKSDRQLAGFYPGGFTIPEGEIWQPVAPVTTDGSVIVYGTLRMRARSGLQFVSIDESKFKGAAAGGDAVSDVGLYVLGSGRLDIVGTEKRSWRRGTTSDPTWNSEDTLFGGPIAPVNPFAPVSEQLQYGYAANNVASFHRLSVGGPVAAPLVYGDGSVVRQPVVNLSQDVVIQGEGRRGRAHILVQSDQPQIVQNAQVRHMGPDRVVDGRRQGVLGRYALHFHRTGDGARGSVVKDVVFHQCSNHAMVTHSAHGVTHTRVASVDCVSPFWWDEGDSTEDGTWSDFLVMGVPDRDALDGLEVFGAGEPWQEIAAFTLGAGSGGRLDAGQICGVARRARSSGLHWNQSGADHVWNISDVTIHNCHNDGWRVWVSRNRNNQLIAGTGNVVANCGRYGVVGGYQKCSLDVRNVRIRGCLGSIAVGGSPHPPSLNTSNTQFGPFRSDGYHAVFEGMETMGGRWSVVQNIDNAGGERPWLFKDCSFNDQGFFQPVTVGSKPEHMRWYDVVNCTFQDRDISPDDIRHLTENGLPCIAGSRIRVQSGNTAFEVDLHTGVVKGVAAFY